MKQIRLNNLIFGLGAVLLLCGLPQFETDKPSYPHAPPQYRIKDYDRAIELNPDDADAYFMRAYTRDSESYTKPVSERNLNSKQIVADYSRAIELRPTWDYAYISRASAYSTAGNDIAAVQDFDRAIKLHPYGTTYQGRALMRQRCGDIAGAIADLDRAIELDTPGLFDAYFERANLQARKGDYRGAVCSYLNAYKLDENRTVNRFLYQSKWELKSVLGAAVPKSEETLKSLVSAVREVLRT